MKKILSTALVIIMIMGIIPIGSITASAASYPLVFLDTECYNSTIIEGNVGKLVFTIFPEYKNEKCYVEIYDNSNNKIGSAEESFYNYNISYRNYTVNVNTNELNMGVGEYTIKYYMSFYSFYEWHYAPNAYTTKLYVIADTCKGNHSYETSVYTEPTCSKVGREKLVCKKCNYKTYKDIPKNPEGHDWSLSETTKAPTCDQKGVGIYKCKTCGITKTESIKANGHQYSNSSDIYCNVCNHRFEKPTIKNINGTWLYYNDGVQTDDTTLVNHYGTWYYVENGKVNWKSDTLCYYGGTWYYAKNGKVDWNCNTLCKYGNTWYYVQKGKVNWNATTLCKYGNTWYYVQKGKVNWNATTLCKYGNTWYYVEKGKVNFNATTLCYYGGTWYYVEKGKVNFNATTLCYYGGTWYYVEKGKVNFNATTLCKYGNTWYYVEKGKVNFKANLSFNYYGTYYNVRNGVVKF